MIPSDKRRLNKLWENSHTHDGDTLQQQITIIRETVERTEAGVAIGGSGAFLHLSRAAIQEIDATGELISWDTEYAAIPRFEFHPQLTLPLTEITIPLDGYYNVAVQLGWDLSAEGGAVKIFRNPSAENEQVWPPSDDPGLWTAADGSLFEGVAPAIPFKAGDTFGVWLDPGSASAEDLASGTLAVYLVDRVLRNVLYYQAVMASGPIAYWRMDDTTATAVDSAGHASGPFNGTYVGTYSQGADGVMLDGSGSKSVQFTNGGFSGSDWAALEFSGGAAHSFEAWIVVDGYTGTFGVIVQKRETGGGNGWDFLVESNNTVLVAETGASSVQISSAISTGTRYHVVATNDGSDLRLYVNGIEVATDAAVSINASTAALSVGHDVVEMASNFDGRIDEVAIYDRALTIEEIENHYNIGSL
jgi:hypothetical protein